MDRPDEQRLVEAMTEELNSNLGASLLLHPELNREVGDGPGAAVPGKVIMVGGSNARRTGLALRRLGFEVSELLEPGWRATKAKVDRFVERLGQMAEMQEENVAVVFQLLDNNVYMALTEEGSLIPSRMGQDGKYHVDGALVMASKEMQFNTFRIITPLLEAAGKKKTILVSPIPRYFDKKCCEDPDHIPNFENEDYKKVLEGGLFESRKLCKDFTFRLKLRGLRVIGATKELRELGSQLWDGSDAVHLAEAGYDCIAEQIRINLEEMHVKRAMNNEPGPSAKRARGHNLGRRDSF